MPTPDFAGAVWRKSSRSNQNQACVEVAVLDAASWRKSSRSNGNQACVEVAATPDVAGVRDSKNPAAGALVLGAGAWTAFRAAIKHGALDLS